MPSTASQQSDSSSSRSSTSHKVKKGETLSGIAKKHHTTVAKIKQWNNIGKKSKILPGQRLRIKKR
ncbi:MAG: LysM domain-containing protein [Paludibacteraceae bacterium]